MGGAIGSLFVGIFADKSVGGFDASGELFGKQLVCVVVAAVHSYLMTMVLLLVIGKVVRLKPTTVEITDVDKSFHGENAYIVDDSNYAGTNFAKKLGMEGAASPNGDSKEGSKKGGISFSNLGAVEEGKTSTTA